MKTDNLPSPSPVADVAVRDLFNAKAASWKNKYENDGPLSPRLVAFERRLSQLVSPPAEVLDLGCGTGDLSAYLSQRGYQVTACDIADEMLASARASFVDLAQWVHLSPNWKQLPFADQSLSAVVASSVLEYVADLPATLRELARVLQPGGYLLFTVPNAATSVRRFEAVLQPVARALGRFHLPAPLAKIDRYLSYLRLSKHRLSVGRWNELLAPLEFVPVQDPATDESSDLVGPRAPLILLTYKRSIAGNS